MVGVEVGANGGMDAGRPLAALAKAAVAAGHAVHVGRRAAEVGKVALEVGHLCDLLHLLQHALGRTAHDEFPLVGRDGAEGTAAEAAAVDVHGELDHLVGRDAFALVLRVGQARVGKTEGAVYLLRGHRREGRIDHNVAVAYGLHEALRVEAVALLLDVAEVFGISLAVLQAHLVAVEHDVVGLDAAGQRPLRFERDSLGNGPALQGRAEGVDREHAAGCVRGHQFLLQGLAERGQGEFAHAVDYEVRPAVEQDAGAERLFPIVVVGEASQRGFDAAEHHGHFGEEFLEDARVDDGGILGPLVVATVGTVGILGTEAAVGRVFVHHGVHAARGNGKEELGSAEFAKIAEVTVPVRLWNDGDAIAFSLQRSTDDSRAE